MSRNQLQVWEVGTGRRHQLQNKQISLDSCTWGPDGKRIAGTSRSDGRAWVWEVETGRGQELEGPAGG
eukprot:707167-Hanusia_phi.AAC.1